MALQVNLPNFLFKCYLDIAITQSQEEARFLGAVPRTEDLLEMQILILYPRLTESETLGMGSNNLNDKHTQYWCVCACEHAQVLQSRLFATPWTIAHEDPLSMGILQARILKWVAMPSSRGSSQLRDGTRVCCTSCIVGGFFTH